MASAANKEIIQQFYIAYYGRPGDPAGVDYWADRLEAAGGVLSAVLDAFGNSAEADAQFGAGREDATRAEIEASVSDIYQQTFGRAPDAAGLDFYADGVEAGTFTLIDVAKRIVDGRTGDDVTILANKTTAATAYTDALRSDSTANTNYSGDSAGDVGRSWLSGVGLTAASVTTAQGTIATSQASLAPLSFTLTTAANTVTGGPVDDTITGVTDALSSDRTLTGADSISGGAGTDTLRVTLGADFGGFMSGVGKMSAVEVLDLTNSEDETRTFNTSGATGITDISIDANDNSFTVSNLAAAGITVEVSNADAASTLTLGFATAAVKGTADSLDLILNSVGTAGTSEKVLTIDAAGIENITVTSSGTANVIDLASGALKTLTVSGSGDLKITDVDATLVSVAAGTTSGDLDFDLDTSTAKLTTVTTGSGDDTVSVASTVLESISTGAGDDSVTTTALNVEATLSGGDGDDSLTLSGVTGTKQPTISGFETLVLSKMGGAATIISGANITGVTTIEITDDINGNDVTVSGLTNTAMTINLAEPASTTWGTATNKLIYTGAAALTVNASTGDATGTIATGITAANATSLDLTVSEGVTLDSDFTVAKASKVSLTVEADATYSGDITAATASTLTLTVDGTTTSSTLTAAKATTVTATLGEDSAFDSTISAAAATSVTVNSSDTDAIALKLSTAAATTLSVTTESALTLDATTDLSAIQSVTFSGSGSVNTTGAGASGADFGDKSASVTIDASELKGAFTTTIGAYEATEGAVNITGSELGVNTITIESGRNEITVIGGISDDTVTISEALTGVGTYSFDLGTTSTGDTLVFSAATVDLSKATLSLTGVDVVTIGTTLTVKSSAVSGIETTFNDGALKISASSASTINLANLGNGTATISVTGSTGADIITGSLEDDTLDGGSGADSIVGGSGADSIVGGVGADTLTGGSGDDIFYFDKNSSTALKDSSGTALTASAITNGASINATTADVITDFGDFGTDTLTFDTVVLSYPDSTFAYSATPVDNDVILVRGTYDSATKIFTYDSSATSATTNYATLVIYDANMTATTVDFRGVVLMGFYDSTPDADNTGTTGLGGTGG